MNNTNWQKVFLFGVLVAVPLITVAFNVLAFVLVSHKHPDTVVADNYYRRGLEINRVVNRDRQAEALHIGADISINWVKGDVDVTLSGEMPLPDFLSLSFTHPTNARRDSDLLLEYQPGGHYTGQIDYRLQNHWYLELSPGETGQPDWRIRGSVDIGEETGLSVMHL